VTRINAERVEIEITAPNAATVELMADFTEWQPIKLERAGGVWRVAGGGGRPITSGLHRVSIRVDGGPWTVPSNLPRADASPDASFGLVTVP
jgi:hypothetical protein